MQKGIRLILTPVLQLRIFGKPILYNHMGIWGCKFGETCVCVFLGNIGMKVQTLCAIYFKSYNKRA